MSQSAPPPTDNALTRRRFLQATGAATAGLLVGAGRRPIMAGPFEENDYLRYVPADKKLDPSWVASLYARGRKQVYRGAALRSIGMPVGGIGAGHVYLGGDGRLWLWQVFNHHHGTGLLGKGSAGATFLEPLEQVHPFAQGFGIAVDGVGRRGLRPLDASGFADVTFEGRYPLGLVTYADPACPVSVRLEAFSPFIPLDAENSEYPATVLRYTVTNTGDVPVTATVAGWTDNPVCLYTGSSGSTWRRNRVLQRGRATLVACTAEEAPAAVAATRRPDVPFEDFEHPTYGDWTVAGEAFGTGPVALADIPSYQGDVKGQGRRVVNSHASAPGDEVGARDRAVGSLLSPAFPITRHFIRLRLGGGRHQTATGMDALTGKGRGGTGVELWIDGRVVRFVTGPNSNAMRYTTIDVREFEGRSARLKIVDRETGAWGNVGVDEIVFTDERVTGDPGPLTERHDYGSFALGLVGRADRAAAAASLDDPLAAANEAAARSWGEPLIGSLSRTLRLEPGASGTATFVLAWHFPNLSVARLKDVGRHYAQRFTDAADVAARLIAKLDTLTAQTRAWTETWYDSTLPYWLLDRAMANTSTLATNTFYRFRDGRYYGWEGIECCEGTCAHVWHYAQGPGRLFPSIERDIRERVDFGLALGADGAIHYRGEAHNHHADDGQCGRILGVLREHQMSPDDGFLQRLWPRVKRSLVFMMQRDTDGDGLLDGAQPNTLDAAWYGKISFTSSLYLAALRAGERMATAVGDTDFAAQCRRRAEVGAQGILQTYNGEYFYQIEDPAHRDKIGVGPGCYIDQIFGQTWAHWVGLGRLFDRDKQLSALRALWTHNFVPDNGPFREHFKRGRWYAAAGDAGLIMCAWPRGGQNPNFSKHWQYGYFNECMTGFEWQAAAHMVWEGKDQPDLLEKGLAVGRAIHDRYDATLRNPYNEIECSDHYARAMASYGFYQAVCGFNCDGPRGALTVAPRLSPEDFRAAFTTAEGWGSYGQSLDDDALVCTIDLRWGRLRVQSLTVGLPAGMDGAGAVTVTLGEQSQHADAVAADGAVTARFPAVTVTAGQTLELRIGRRS